MRLRLRGPNGQSAVTLDSESTVRDLRVKIVEATSIHRPDIRIGYPPQPFALELYDEAARLSDLNVQLEGEQLIVSESVRRTATGNDREATDHSIVKNQRLSSTPEGSTTATNVQNPFPRSNFDAVSALGALGALASSGAVPGGPPMRPLRDNSIPSNFRPNNPLSLTRKSTMMATEPPEVPLPTHSSTLILRIMPDDNSCLFRAFGSAFFRNMDNMTELRSLVAQTIQSQPENYPAVVLEKTPDDYCRWIQTEDAWGGFIELDILSKHFEIEICSIDVQTLRVDRFNEGRPQRCILVYSGIHYDVIARSPSPPPFKKTYAPPDSDIKVFESDEKVVLEAALDLCKILQERHYFTDSANFEIRCNQCGQLCRGEKGATEHAKATGHYDFGEGG